MKKILFNRGTLLFSLYASAQHVALKNNIIYDATATPNLGLEVGLGKKVTMDLSAGYNPFEFSNDKQAKHWLAHAGVRFWTCEKFNGTFIGIHALGGQYDVADFKLPFDMFKKLENHRYDGYLYGGASVSAINGYYLNAGESKPRSVQVMPACITTEYAKGKDMPKLRAGTTITGSD